MAMFKVHRGSPNEVPVGLQLICTRVRNDAEHGVTRVIVALFILRVASLGSCLVLYECATPDVTSTLVNCNEVGSQLPHRTHISRSSRLKNPGERNDDVLGFSIRVLNV